MKMKLLIIGLFSLLIASVSFAVDSTKPSTHNSTWEKQHGQAAKTNMAECLTCHEERSECIACHEDTAPRNHTVTFVNKTHGLESRWNRTACQILCIRCCNRCSLTLRHKLRNPNRQLAEYAF